MVRVMVVGRGGCGEVYTVVSGEVVVVRVMVVGKGGCGAVRW